MNAEFSPEERILMRGKQVQLDDLESLNGWYPAVATEDGLWWRFLGEKKFSEPFFFDTLARAEKFCLNTDYAAPEQFDKPLAPAAFVFHASRCGSTLLTQLLLSLPECIALSEPPAIDFFLRHYYAGQHGDEAEQRLRNIVAALGHRRFAEERHLLVKLDSWHIRSLPLFRKTFPDTPFLFLYRDPAEIMTSHRRQRGRQMVPGLVAAAMPPLDFDLPEPWDLDGYCARMLESFFRAACRYAEELILVNYRQLPHVVWDELPGFLGISLSPEQREAMKSRSSLHSKSGMQFSGDPLAMNAETCGPALDACYAELERLRNEQNRFPSARMRRGTVHAKGASMTIEELCLRRETEEDASFLKALFRSTKADMLPLGLPPEMLDNLLEMQFHAQRSSYRNQYPASDNSIIEKKGETIGVMLKNVGASEIRLIHIALLPEERGKGYGRRLIKELQQEAALAEKPLTLSVDPRNDTARGLYLSLGFQVTQDDGANLEMVWRAGMPVLDAR